MNLNENEYKDNFTKEGEKTNLNINKLEVDCITSNQNNFSLDEEGNLKVNSISLNNTNTDIDLIYPIGSIYMNVSNVNPNTLFGGAWEKIKDRFLLASGENYQNGTTGGRDKVELSAAIGACNNDADTLGYCLESTNEYQKNHVPHYVIPGNHRLEYRHWNHSTIVTDFSSSDRATNIMNPYLVVNIWKRVA